MMWFFSRIMHVHLWLMRCTVLSVVYNNCPDQQDPQLANWTRMRHDEAGTYSFSRACHNHCWIVTMGARSLGQSITGWHSAPLWLFACENTRLHYHRGGTLCIDVAVGSPLYCNMCVSFGLNLSYTPTIINYLSHEFWIQWICSWRCCIVFSGSVYWVRQKFSLAPLVSWGGTGW